VIKPNAPEEGFAAGSPLNAPAPPTSGRRPELTPFSRTIARLPPPARNCRNQPKEHVRQEPGIHQVSR